MFEYISNLLGRIYNRIHSEKDEPSFNEGPLTVIEVQPPEWKAFTDEYMQASKEDRKIVEKLLDIYFAPIEERPLKKTTIKITPVKDV